MAGSVCLSFSLVLSVPRTSLKDIFCRKAARGRVASQSTGITATKLLMPCGSNKGKYSANWRSQHHLPAPINHFGELISCCLNFSSCTHMVIIGYWVGPDVDDGWGFVDAFISQIT
ncbi:uncharacterized protein LOC120011320 [Tripterygium wilfordii]|uniref:uncharacterized protein LOC120011320 n=1 Tax=Tripterygium wilfordii TaxID=458696 RepID=UPI0018F85B9D|nr:uncharacterized protein LOC120011320 [Tripterygium wilfordii]